MPSLLERFEGKYIPEPNSGCWIWIGAISPGKEGKYPYGLFTFDGKLGMAHRFSYQHFIGPIPIGLQLDHLCKNKLCVNPKHLEPVTARENIIRSNVPLRCKERGSAITHCPQGHSYSGNNLYLRPNGRRECRQCVRESGARYRSKNRKRN